MIRKYGVDIEKMSEVIQNVIKFRMRIEKLEKKITESTDETKRKQEKIKNFKLIMFHIKLRKKCEYCL